MTDAATQDPGPESPQDVEGPSEARSAPVRTEDFTVRLDEVFQGPLDLLLHLVKEQEVEIQEVRLADVAHAYMDHVRALGDLDIEVAGEYLVIAATLMAIKSRSLLPREEVELEDDLDPQDELIQRLIEYRRFKGASDDLEDRFHRRSLEHPRGYRGEVRDNEPEKVLELGEITAWDLLATFSRLMRETLAGRSHTIKSDPRPLRWYVQTIGAAVRRNPSGTSLRSLVEELAEVPSREGIVGAFCALLELMKIGLVSARQEEREDDIVLEWAAEPGTATDLDDLIRASRFMDEEDEELESSLDDGAGAEAEEARSEDDGAEDGSDASLEASAPDLDETGADAPAGPPRA
ncbi:MAG: segregation/condensation protein A [Planctomycetota bacterium]